MIKEIMIDNERVNLKKDFLGWSVVYPIRNPDGSLNWFNIITGGSWIKFTITLFTIGVILLCLFDYANAIKVANECLTRNINLLP